RRKPVERFGWTPGAEVQDGKRPAGDCRVRAEQAVHTDPSLPAAMLVRPDGYIAWAANRAPVASAELSAVLARWCGPRPGVACATR
ncbi:MAG TPA: hypothetical protein VML93_10160, partial [Mycobacterium sp.]|nr:hypothetical protein [Mycobacterium sp.]